MVALLPFFGLKLWNRKSITPVSFRRQLPSVLEIVSLILEYVIFGNRLRDRGHSLSFSG